MSVKGKKHKLIVALEQLMGEVKLGFIESLKFVVGYIVIYALLRLAEYGLMALLVSGYAEQVTVQYAVFVGAVVLGLAAQLLALLGVAFVIIFAAIVAVFLLRRISLGPITSKMVKPLPDYSLSRYAITFGEKIERPKAKTKAKPKAKTTRKPKQK